MWVIERLSEALPLPFVLKVEPSPMLGTHELLARAGGHAVTSNSKPQRTNDSDLGNIFGARDSNC